MDISRNKKGVNETFHKHTYKVCKDGVLLSAWLPQTYLTTADRLLRGFFYFIIMVYLFIGMAIIAQRFLVATEVITTAERNIIVKLKNGTKTVHKKRIWNEVIASLTISTFAYSSPQIVLTLLDIIGNDFNAGSLGPSLVVGCGMFNITVILAIMVMVVPKGVSLRIKDYPVYYVILFWSFVGYLWMYFIIAVWDPEKLSIWECMVLLSFFPVSVVCAYIANKRMFIFKLFHYASTSTFNLQASQIRSQYQMGEEEDVDFEQARTEYITTFKNLRIEYPNFDIEKLELMAHEKILIGNRKTRGLYRVMATQKLFGTGGLVETVRERAELDFQETKSQLMRIQIKVLDENAEIRLFFEPGHYTILDTVEEFELRVVRHGTLSIFTSVDYRTGDGTAIAHRNYVPKMGTLYFPAGIHEQRLKIEILNDKSFKEDLQFYVKLKDPQKPAVLSTPKMATVMIIDTNHSGVFEFSQELYNIEENIGVLKIPILRTCGSRGEVKLPYRTLSVTAIPGKHYEDKSANLLFLNEEMMQTISINIYDEKSYEKAVTFTVDLGYPEAVSEVFSDIERKPPERRSQRESVLLLGKPRLGEKAVAMIIVNESSAFKNKVDMLVDKANTAILVGASHWTDNFKIHRRQSAVANSETDEVDGGWPGISDYVMHWITIFWKTVFMIVPPTKIANGYLCLAVSLLITGIIATLLIDVSSQMGCTLGIKGMIMAVFFIVIGTMVPDMVAGELCAIHNPIADDTVCGLFSGNTVTLFAVGLAWTIGSIHHYYQGEKFYMAEKNLAFMTAIYIPTQVIVAIIIFIRGKPPIEAELGGPVRIKYITSGILFSLWLIFICLCILKAYTVI